MGINEMDFQWRLNWWYRPTQLDGSGTSVADYYDYFCDWKADMELNECPAHEVDYVAAFIQNLRCDIQSRLPTYVYSGGLFCAFLAAKLEESMMRVDEALKNIGAHKPFDESSQADQPQVSSSSLPTSSSYSCLNEIVADNSSVIEEKEFSVLEDDESLEIELEKATHMMLDNFPEQNICESSSIDQESNGDCDVKFASPNTAYPVFDGLPQMTLTDTTTYELIDDSELNSQEATCNQDFGTEENDEMLVKIEENPVKDVSPNANDKVFGELPKPALTTTTSYKLLDDDCNVYSELNFHKDSGVCYKVFDEMPRLFFFEPNEKINGDMDSIIQLDFLPRVFDPGISISFKDVRAAVIATTSLHNELFLPSITATTGLKCHSFATFLGQCKTVSFTNNDMVIIFDPGGRKNEIHNLGSNQRSQVMEEYTAIAFLENPSSIVTQIIELDVEFWLGKILMFVFDPSGSSWSHDIRDLLLFTDDKQHFDKSCGLAGSVLAFLRNGKAVLIVLSSWCIGRDSGTVIEVMVVYFGRFLLSFTTYEYLAKVMVMWNLLVHIWRDILVAFSKVKMAKSQHESAVSGYDLKASRSLIECCKETNLRVPGSTLYYRGCELLWPNNARQTCAFCDFWVDEWTNTEVQICWTDPCLRNENNVAYSSFGELENGIYPANLGALLLFSHGGSYYLLRAGIGNEEYCKLFCLINGIAGNSWLGNGCDTINKRSNAFESRDDRQHHDHFSANQGATFLREKMLDSAVCWPSDLRYEAGALGDIATRISPNSKFELYDNSWVVVMSILVFDPGGSWCLMKQYKQKISGLSIKVKRKIEIERVALEMLASQSNFGSTFFLASGHMIAILSSLFWNILSGIQVLHLLLFYLHH